MFSILPTRMHPPALLLSDTPLTNKDSGGTTKRTRIRTTRQIPFDDARRLKPPLLFGDNSTATPRTANARKVFKPQIHLTLRWLFRRGDSGWSSCVRRAIERTSDWSGCCLNLSVARRKKKIVLRGAMNLVCRIRPGPYVVQINSVQVEDMQEERQGIVGGYPLDRDDRLPRSGFLSQENPIKRNRRLRTPHALTSM